MSKLPTALLAAGFAFGINTAAGQNVEFDPQNAKTPEQQITQNQVDPNATWELQTRYGRFCIAPPAAFPHSDLARSLTLASRCAMF